MKKRWMLLLAFALVVITASGTHGVTLIALDRPANVDIVDQNAGLLAVSQTTTGYNATTNRADLTVDVTNQLTVRIDQIHISADGTTRTTGPVVSGASDSVSFTEVDCDQAILIEYGVGSVEQRIETDIRCQ